MSEENWEGTMRMLEGNAAGWEVMVAFHERPVVERVKGWRLGVVVCSEGLP